MHETASVARSASAVPFSWPVRVYYEDTDTSGVVYHAAYLKFMERARTEWLRAAGFNQEVLRVENDVAFTVSRMAIAYLRPARLDDELAVSVDVAKLGRASFNLTQVVSREKIELCTATIRIACVSAGEFRPRAIPEAVKLESLRDH